ncbi:hypothetical protein E1A91_D08G213800v1, partial [Gossypium mustelinum]
RIVADARCPRCKLEEEDCNHIFRECSTIKDVWRFIQLSWVLNNAQDTFWNWLTWVFSRGTTEQCRIFCCGLWTIWTNRNKLVYENRQTTARDISYKISDFFAELKGIEEKKHILADV